MLRRISGLVVASSMIGLVGCGSSGTLDLEFIEGSEGAGRVNAYAPAALTITRLELQVREVKALPDDGSDDDKYKAKGTYTLDLLDSSANTVSFPDAEPVVYKKVEFKVDKPDDGAGIDGTSASLWYEGDQDGIAFRYLDDNMDKITLRDETGADLSDGGSAVLYVNLDVSSWLNGVDLSALEVDDQGVVVIDADGSNKDAHKTIEDNVQAAIKLAREP